MATSDRFREHMAEACAADPAVEALVAEACRIIDRLDHIDDIVTGKSEWIQLMHFRTRNGDQQQVQVSLDGVLSEARQQAAALKAIMAQLGVGKAEVSDKSEKAVDPVDEIARRRSARGAGPAAGSGRAAGRA